MTAPTATPTLNDLMAEFLATLSDERDQILWVEREFAADYIDQFKLFLYERNYSFSAISLIPTPYIRPEATDDDKSKAKANAEYLLKKRGLSNFGRMLALLCLENVMLVREINEHRTARGIEPLKTHEV